MKWVGGGGVEREVRKCQEEVIFTEETRGLMPICILLAFDTHTNPLYDTSSFC